MNEREQRGLVIAGTSTVRRDGDVWRVLSQTGRGSYSVTLTPQPESCTCPDHAQRRAICKHIYAVRSVAQRETSPDGTVTETVTETVTHTKRTTYRQNWTAYNAAQSEESERFAVLLHELCAGIPQPPQATGRPRLPLGDMVLRPRSKCIAAFPRAGFRRTCADPAIWATSPPPRTSTACQITSQTLRSRPLAPARECQQPSPQSR